MKKSFLKYKLISIFAFLPVLTLLACKMPAHAIEFVVNDKTVEDTIFDKIYRLTLIDDTLTALVDDDKSTNTESLVTKEYKQDKGQRFGDIAKEFYESFNTRTKDTYITKFAITNAKFAETKLNFNKKDVLVLEEIRKEETEKSVGPFNFELTFQGFTKQFLLSGTVKWNYKISKNDDDYTFLWLYKSSEAQLQLNKIEEKK